MRVLQLLPLWERVPPKGYGGIEFMASLLTEELVRLGHEVTMAASGDSATNARLFSIYGRSLRTAKDVVDPWPYNWVHVAAALKQAEGFDIVHNHASELGMAMHALSPVPMITTVHNEVTPDARTVWRHYRGYYSTPSRAGRRGLSFPNFAGVIYHGIDVNSFAYRESKDDYLLFLSRMSPEKGPLAAIEVAKMLNTKLIMAGNVDEKDREFFEAEVEPLIDGRLIEYHGEADWNTKRRLYRDAKCLLFPIDWNEPFGLVMVEAMASGTPVVAFRRGAAPEVIWDGVSGFVVDDIEGMAAAVRQVDRLEPRRIRQYTENRFSVETMTRSYVRAYHRVLVEWEESRDQKWHAASPLAVAG